jgi:hypothetical protein
MSDSSRNTFAIIQFRKYLHHCFSVNEPNTAINLHLLALVEGSIKAVSRLRERVSKVPFTLYVTELACSKCTQIHVTWPQVQDI